MSSPSGPLTPLPPGSSQSEADQLKLANHYLRVALDQVAEGVIMLDVGPLDGTGHVFYIAMCLSPAWSGWS